MRYFFCVFILSFFIVGCSSGKWQAPISDLTLSEFQRHNVKKSDNSTYTVQKWDTLYGIAWVNNLSIKVLIRNNHLSSPYTIYLGQVLILVPELKKGSVSVTSSSKKRELYYESLKKSKKRVHQSQSTIKKVHKGLVQKKATVYAKHSIDKKVTLNRGKVSVWQWPTKGKLIKIFSASQSGMKGISLKDKRGTAIYAAASGIVVYAGSGLRGYGNLIIIKHSYDYLSAYAHNEKLLVHENESIKVGQKIATMGDSGTNNVFLHFEIRYRGKSVDPERYLPER
ncbi:peptidoglycan DD-metalloendopeptidase family protein [Psychromonas sp. CD1]|uniref:peptidoglycan DD-metalloendopeptidase family protein n=1 Tax=Psychromonas sp. CD1 TaxID=1979839 RepID=UPI000B9AF50E|nr:peptidoglycan DD-metalloendopeptidase family protein [Psychromonas sp. CD1]